MTVSVKYLRKRGERYYFDVDGVPARVTNGYMTQLELNYNGNGDGYVSLIDNGLGTVYRDSDREWDDKADTYFYPFADEREVTIWNAVINELNARFA